MCSYFVPCESTLCRCCQYNVKFLFIELQSVKTRASSPQCRAGVESVRSLSVLVLDVLNSAISVLCGVWQEPANPRAAVQMCLPLPHPLPSSRITKNVHGWIQGGQCVPAHDSASPSHLVGVWQYEDSTRVYLPCDRGSLMYPSFVIQSECLPLDIQSAPPIQFICTHNITLN